jgi:aminoglycoside phosphotransferase (APT) family kinase protein
MTLAPAVNVAALQRYLSARLSGWDGPVTVDILGEGHSNLTYLLRCGPREIVLRRPPRGPILPTAHDVLREFRVLKAVEDTPVPTPKVVLACEDDSVIGAPFYLMERMSGNVIRSALPSPFDSLEHARSAIGEEMVRTLAALHNLDWRTMDLEGFGRPHGYLERQIKRWNRQLEGARSRDIPDLDEVSRWLADHLPESPPATIVHGDYKLDNVMFAPESPTRLVAVFDWEMSTVGDPLADLGWMLAYWRQPGDPPPDRLTTSRVTELPGFHTRAELTDMYSALTGRSMSDVTFYHALAVWKLAIILEGSYRRFLAGTTDDATFPALERGVPALAQSALAICRGEI